MKRVLLFIFAYFSVVTFTYGQSGKVTYSIKVQEFEKEVPKNIEPFITKMVANANNQKFELIFNKTSTSFKMVQNLNNSDGDDKKMGKVAQSAFTSSSDIYLDYANKKEVHRESDGQLVLDVYKDRSWEITKESKMIDGNKCFKAIYKISFVNRKGENKTKDIIAWFAPALPYRFGPKNYFGLPGLILELNENSTVYLATKLEIGKTEIQINFPKGKTITRQEYDSKMKANINISR